MENSPQSNSPADTAQLKKSIGFWTATSIVVGIVIGSGVFVKPGLVLKQAGSSSHALLAWAIGGAMTIAAGLTIGEVASRIPKTGGIYAYIEEVYGERLGFLSGWVLTFLYGPGLMGALSLYFATLLQPFIGYDNSIITTVAIATVSFLALMNILGTKYGGYIQTTTAAIKLIPIFGILVFGLVSGEKDIFASLSVDPVTVSLGSAILSTLWAYDGWMLVGNVAGEMQDAKKILPRAIIIGLFVVIIAYLGVNTALLKILSADRIAELNTGAAGVAAEILFGKWGGKFLSIGILISIFGCLNGAILSSPRIPFAMAKKGDLRACDWLAKIHPRFRTPISAIILQSIVAIAMVMVASPDQITDFAIFSVYIFYTLAFFAIFILRKKQPVYEGYRTPFYPVVPLIAALSAIYILGNTVLMQTKIAVISIAITALGTPIYALLKRK